MDEIIGADPALDAAGGTAGGVTRRRLIYAAPALAAVGLAALFASRLGVDPSQIPSNLIGKPVPVFSLPPVQGRTLGLSSGDLHGEVSLVNVFASWCVACREGPLNPEALDRTILPLVTRLREQARKPAS
jgi:cytochrome c biogenesis protein CcmG/thiol:disulfide interchange protein DsbE